MPIVASLSNAGSSLRKRARISLLFAALSLLPLAVRAGALPLDFLADARRGFLFRVEPSIILSLGQGLVALKVTRVAHTSKDLQVAQPAFLGSRHPPGLTRRLLHGVFDIPDLDREFTVCCPPSDKQHHAGCSEQSRCTQNVKQDVPAKRGPRQLGRSSGLGACIDGGGEDHRYRQRAQPEASDRREAFLRLLRHGSDRSARTRRHPPASLRRIPRLAARKCRRRPCIRG
jgi:hypothetical protein